MLAPSCIVASSLFILLSKSSGDRTEFIFFLSELLRAVRPQKPPVKKKRKAEVSAFRFFYNGND
jgi:hypothetical protein